MDFYTGNNTSTTVALTEMTTAEPTEVMTHPVIAHVTQALTPAPAPPHREATDAFTYWTETTTASYIAPHPAASSDDGSYEAVIGGVIAALLLVLICIAVVVLHYVSSQKGSYLTHEMDEDEELFDSHVALKADTVVDDVEEE